MQSKPNMYLKNIDLVIVAYIAVINALLNLFNWIKYIKKLFAMEFFNLEKSFGKTNNRVVNFHDLCMPKHYPKKGIPLTNW